MLTVSQAADLLNNNKAIHLNRNKQLVENQFSQDFVNFFRCKKRDHDVIQIIQFIKEKLNTSFDEKELVHLGDALIKKYRNVKTLSNQIDSLDHILGVARKRFGREDIYLRETNECLLSKWSYYGFDESIFKDYPEFAQFLINSTLASQIKVTRDTIQKINNLPCILVEGKWTSFEDLVTRFEYKYVEEFNEVLLHEKDTGKIFSYLDRGLGLEHYHPYKEGLNRPISRIGKDDYHKTLAAAQKFVRNGDAALQEPNKDRSYIFQIVSNSFNLDTNHPIVGNYRKEMSNSQHPYIRMINPEGDVFEIGYMLGEKLAQPLNTTKGRFRSIDPYEFIQFDQRYVTNVAITREEFEKARDYSNTYLNSSTAPSFNFMQQNCTVFTRNIFQAATGIRVPTERSIFKVAAAITPEFIKKIGRAISRCVLSIARPIAKIIPNCIKNGFNELGRGIKKAAQVFAAFFLSIINLLLGGAKGIHGRKFTQDPYHSYLSPPLLKLKNWFSIHVYNINYVNPLQEWQKAQPSTVLYRNPLKLTIVPN